MILLILSCSNSKNDNHDKQVNKEKLPSNVLNLGADFSPFLDISKDSILFAFSKRIAFDTSWILVLKKSKDNLYACYNQLIPSYHRDVHDYLDESSKLLYYEGLVFDLDNDKFKNIINSVGVDKFESKDTTATTCTHCPYYTLYYNSQVYRSTRQSQDFLDSLGKYLKSNILNALLEKKRNPPTQLQK